jgi:4-aminobutyrate aminotransferase-like enzyme
VSAIPGPRSRALASRLAARESRNVTYLSEDFPIFWDRASRATVSDVDANRYTDLTAAFGVASVGHANPAVAAAVADQAERLMHGMGDVHPTEVRVRLFERLAEILPTELDTFFLATTGSEAIEAALKTAVLATGKHRFASYNGAYHGLSLAALALCGIERFRAPFSGLLPQRPILLDFPRSDAAVEDAIAAARATLAHHEDVAALFVEPIQARGGCLVPPQGYLRGLQAVCAELRVLLVVDEIYTGFGRTGDWFAIQHDGVVPDMLCIGKAMGGGIPIGALAARASVMEAWPRSEGEALHTSTFLGNPIGCAAALATIDEIERLGLPARARRLGTDLAPRFASLARARGIVDVRGRGLMWGIEMQDGETARRVAKAALARGVIVLQAGVRGEVISITPPIVIGEEELDRALAVLETIVREAT